MTKKTVVIVAFCGGLAGFLLLAAGDYFLLPRLGSGLSNPNCKVTKQDAVVQGSSMDGIVKDGTKVTVEVGYYNCANVSRGDLVQYDILDKHIIKKVFGIAGDTFGVQRVSGGWNIVINNTPAVNSANKPYLLSDTDSRMLAYYATSYKGVIPPDTYIILGDAVGGSEDSTAFGLVAKSGLVGRVKL